MERERYFSKTFQHNLNAFHKGRKLINHKKKQKYLTVYETFVFLYVDDVALLVNSRREAILDSNNFFVEMARLCLLMHIGRPILNYRA